MEIHIREKNNDNVVKIKRFLLFLVDNINTRQ